MEKIEMFFTIKLILIPFNSALGGYSEGHLHRGLVRPALRRRVRQRPGGRPPLPARGPRPHRDFGLQVPRLPVRLRDRRSVIRRTISSSPLVA